VKVFEASHLVSTGILEDTALSEVVDAAAEENQVGSHASWRLTVPSGIFVMLGNHQTRLPDAILHSAHAFTVPVTT
jgi:hypothetical protein